MGKRCASAGVEVHDTPQNWQCCSDSRTLGTKATGGGTRDALEPLEAFQAAFFRSAVGLIRYIVLDRPHYQYAAKAVRSATTEPKKNDWMRMMRLAKFLVAHDELEWLYHAQQDVSREIRGAW